MNIQGCTALEARKVFRLRPYKHFPIGGGIFLVLFTGLVFAMNPVVAGLTAGVVAFAVYFYLESRLIVIECLNCEGDINANTPWECGFKGCRNENADEFPFIHECEHCHYEPKAYICHHCGHFIYLTTDRQKAHAAKRLEVLKPVPPPVKTVAVGIDPIKNKGLKQKDEISDLRHELDVAKIKKEIEITRNKPTTPPPVKTESNIIVERVRRGVENGKTLIELEDQLLNEIRAACPSDSDKRRELEQNVRDVIFNEKQRTSGGY